MAKYEFRYHLTEDDWIDVRYTLNENDRIIKFAVNYTALIREKAYPIIRYDNSHGFAHIDRYWTAEKENISNLSNIEIIRKAKSNILENWNKYRSKVEDLLGVLNEETS